MFALVDCNNFYASCERLFRPDLAGRPVIVLSNNDGCAVARSNEAKALGVKMGDPYFKIQALCKQHNIAVFSSNYTLYGDLSQRVMSTIIDNWPEVELYSIDEAFLDLKTLPENEHAVLCENLQRLILKHTGIPTSIGIGKTKTLAKLANHIAKKHLFVPVFNINSQKHWLDKIDVNDIWGVGRQWTKRLNALGIRTAFDLANANKAFIKKRFNVVLQRTAYELNGFACLALEDIVPKQSILSSRSFGSMQTEYAALAEAVSAHVARAWEKMRAQHLSAQYISVYVFSNPHRKDLRQYSSSTGFQLINASDDLRLLTKCAKYCLKKIYKSGFYYKKAGIMLDGLIPKNIRQNDLFHPISEARDTHTEQLMGTIEGINQRFGRSTIHLAAEVSAKPWAMKRDLKSPGYTTSWHELPLVRINGFQ